ncbi:MAG: OmpA family protein [Deltaproteobacteria bacterium]|jgi:outer membrane protein OmpA-like peptidoglycan-associated protein|nr:OmpA family protein [Deltaproteobacteria bacterium]
MRRIIAALVTLLIMALPAQADRADPEALMAQRLVANQGLFFALAQNNISAMAALRDQGADPNATLAQVGLKPATVFGEDLPIFNQPFNTAGWPLLTWAVYLNNESAVNLLLRAGARVNAPDEYGATPLHWAAWAGRHSLAKELLNNGANCQAKDFKKRSPKDWATMASQTDMIRLLDGRVCRPISVRDEDQDGVPDDQDLCPGTPLGAPVDDRGCWIVAYATFFDFDKSVIKPQFLPHIQQAARILANNPEISVSVVGHADHVGTEAYNYDLGMRRAESVRRELVANGVAPERLLVSSRGESEPIDTNQTSAGRARNRRVEIHVNQAGESFVAPPVANLGAAPPTL